MTEEHSPLPPFFVDWGARNILHNLPMNDELDEVLLLQVLEAFREEFRTKLKLSKELEHKTMKRVVTLSSKRAEHAGTIYGEILAEALRLLLKDFYDLEKATKAHKKQAEVVTILIDSINNALRKK